MTPCEKLGYKVGDRFVVQEGEVKYAGVRTGDVVFLTRDNGTNFPFFIKTGVENDYLCYYIDTDVKPLPKTESERRGVKFGDKVIRCVTGDERVFVKTDPDSPSTWWVVDNFGIVKPAPSSYFRLPSEPEFIPWKDAPEELKYDARRVYHDGVPVKWIAKVPEAGTGVAFVDVRGIVMGGRNQPHGAPMNDEDKNLRAWAWHNTECYDCDTFEDRVEYTECLVRFMETGSFFGVPDKETVH